jgi:hypothetical protein
MHVKLHIQNPKLNFLFRFRFLRASPKIRVRVFWAVCVRVFLVPRPSKDLLLIIRLTSFLSSPQLWYGRLQVKISWCKMSCSHSLQILRKRSSFCLRCISGRFATASSFSSHFLSFFLRIRITSS